ncbi:hypothetical protein [Actinobaculum sp. 352]|uniref:hypothetical protein n=1 Tax=Actinobaculum sp. 352 TaxID=2490946 RepID=UPI000F7DFEFF|nr:hypothetical protein [Actinobaculum sp. 352]RTE47816.1 hypothetical protein EKN07_11895 [Actinobaculum sp. 352]
MVHTRWEVFTSHDEPVGLLYRRWDETELITETAFSNGERFSSRVLLSGNSWTRCEYTEDTDDPIILDALSLEYEPEDAIPSPLVFLLVQRLVNEGADRADPVAFHVIDPSDRSGLARPASIWVPDVSSIDVEIDGVLDWRFRIDNGAIVSVTHSNCLDSREDTSSGAAARLRGIIDDALIKHLLALEA